MSGPALPCSKGELTLVNSGHLTGGADKPAFPPYFEDDDPTNGKGFESAVADQLAFGKADVKWTVVPFISSYAPGPKKFARKHRPSRTSGTRMRRAAMNGHSAVWCPNRT